MAPRIVEENDNRFSFVSIEFALAGRGYTLINALSYADTINRAFVYGTSPYPLSRTRGTYAAGGAFGILKESDADLLAFLGQGYAEKQFDITCTYTEVGQPQVTDHLVSCAFASGKDDWKYSPDGLYVVRDLSIRMIGRNGVYPFKFKKTPYSRR